MTFLTGSWNAAACSSDAQRLVEGRVKRDDDVETREGQHLEHPRGGDDDIEGAARLPGVLEGRHEHSETGGVHEGDA